MNKEEVKVVEEVKEENKEERKRHKKNYNKVRARIICTKSNNEKFTVGKSYPVFDIKQIRSGLLFKVFDDDKEVKFIVLNSKRFGTFELTF